MKIFLTGFMGSGKSHIGPLLAEKLGYDFFDLDRCIELEKGMSVPEIFEREGEPAFRVIERKMLEVIIARQGAIVISTGGGAPCFLNNMELMNENGVTIFLDPPISIIVERIISDIDKRPVLKGLTKETLYDFVEKLLEKRRAFYEQAKLHIKETTTENILPKISAFIINI